MSAQFRIAADITAEKQDWGAFHWLSNPPTTAAKQLTAFEATVKPGTGHDFHKHLDQEEVLYVISGRLEQWVDREKRILGAGDSVFIPAKTVHGSFNAGEGEVKLLVIFSPCVGEAGFEAIDMSKEEPWRSLRK
jgi:quercetin dioxygenase-like cupin family protein